MKEKMHQATLITISKDEKSISEALNVDNKGERIKIKTRRRGKDEIISEVKTKSIRTLLSTLDDLLYCQLITEKLIHRKTKDG